LQFFFLGPPPNSSIRTDACITFTFLRTFMKHTHTPCVIKLLHVPIDSFSWWCDMNRTHSRVLSVYSHTRTSKRLNGFLNKHFLIHRVWHLVIQFSSTTCNKFLNCIERCVKIW
jgi:hypothetical protein